MAVLAAVTIVVLPAATTLAATTATAFDARGAIHDGSRTTAGDGLTVKTFAHVPPIA